MSPARHKDPLALSPTWLLSRGPFSANSLLLLPRHLFGSSSWKYMPVLSPRKDPKAKRGGCERRGQWWQASPSCQTCLYQEVSRGSGAEPCLKEESPRSRGEGDLCDKRGGGSCKRNVRFIYFFKTVNLGKRQARCSWQNKAMLCHKYRPKKKITLAHPDTAVRATWSGRGGEPAKFPRPCPYATLPDSPLQPPHWPATSAPAQPCSSGPPTAPPAQPLQRLHRAVLTDLSSFIPIVLLKAAPGLSSLPPASLRISYPSSSAQCPSLAADHQLTHLSMLPT